MGKLKKNVFIIVDGEKVITTNKRSLHLLSCMASQMRDEMEYYDSFKISRQVQNSVVSLCDDIFNTLEFKD